MAAGSVFLMGGGWNQAAYTHTYGRFAAAAGEAPSIACVFLDTDDRDLHLGWAAAAFATVGVTDVRPVFVSPNRPLRQSDLDGASGIFVGGGMTPAYHDAIVPFAGSWLPEMIASGIPYAGISAGAIIAARTAVVGGWKLEREGTADLVICSTEVSEDEDYLDVRPGLGLVPFTVDAHASQYGTPTRLLHAIDADLATEGWAIDEETMVEATDGEIIVTGLGSAFRIWKDGGLRVEIVQGTH